MSKELTIQHAERRAYDSIASQKLSDGSENPFFVNPVNITMPSFLIQEQALTNASPTLTFSFGTKSVDKSPVLNNIILGDNDVACIYGIQVLIGYGANRNRRQYYSYGANIDDDVVYKGRLSVMFETNKLISDIETNIFRSENGINQSQYDGLMLINPQRLLTGRISEFDVILNMGDVNGFAFTANAFVSMRLLCGRGAASAVKK